MYEKFYNFSEKPFNATPDSKFFFAGTKHLEALNSLHYAVMERKGFVVVTGEIGAGKTTVCRTLINKLGLNTKVALITNTHLNVKELITEILDEFEIEHTGGSKQSLLKHLNKFLIAQLAAETNVVLIIDEAQNLTTKVLEEIRMLSNLETEKEKLIQIILLGQPQLKVKLENSKLEQFKQRIAVFYHISPLSRAETGEYIRYRLNLVTSSGADIFTPEAIDAIFEYSRGIPRLINLTADNALLLGYVDELKYIPENIIQEVIHNRDINNKFDGTEQKEQSQSFDIHIPDSI